MYGKVITTEQIRKYRKKHMKSWTIMIAFFLWGAKDKKWQLLSGESSILCPPPRDVTSVTINRQRKRVSHCGASSLPKFPLNYNLFKDGWRNIESIRNLSTFRLRCRGLFMPIWKNHPTLDCQVHALVKWILIFIPPKIHLKFANITRTREILYSYEK